MSPDLLLAASFIGLSEVPVIPLYAKPLEPYRLSIVFVRRVHVCVFASRTQMSPSLARTASVTTHAQSTGHLRSMPYCACLLTSFSAATKCDYKTEPEVDCPASWNLTTLSTLLVH